jgi:type VI protein secretion system component VasA
VHAFLGPSLRCYDACALEQEKRNMTVTKDDILSLVNSLVEARDTANEATSERVSADANVINTTLVAQAGIDAANANYDRVTTEAKAEASEAASTEAAAQATEQTALDSLVKAAQDFAAGN